MINRHCNLNNPCCIDGRGCFIYTTRIIKSTMDTYNKLKILEDVESKQDFDESKVKIEIIGKTSCKLIYPCGCFSVHHFVVKIDDCKTERSRINKSFFVELCEEHAKISSKRALKKSCNKHILR